MESSFPVLAGTLPQAIAHRGGAWEAPENSELAFRRAIDLGFTFLETDVRATSDGVALVFHDAALDRSTNASGLIRETPFEQVAAARIHGRQSILTLEQVLDLFPGIRFNLDVKEPNAVGPFLDVVRRKRAWTRIVVGSFGHERLRQVRRMSGPRLATSLAPSEVVRLWRLSRGKATRWRPPHAACVQVPPMFGGRVLVDRAFLDTAHDLGWHVHVWTIDHRDEMHRLLDLGVDGIMTDRPTVLRDVLLARGQWPVPEMG